MRQAEMVAETNALAEQSYNQLVGEWLDWLGVARRYEHRVPSQDRYDMRHTILLELAKARHRDNKPIPPLRAYRIASLMIALHWRKVMRQPTILSLHTEIDDNATELSETVADDNASDLDAWLDAERFLLGCPMRLVQIANKKVRGIPLNKTDARYYERQRLKELKRYQLTLL